MESNGLRVGLLFLVHSRSILLLLLYVPLEDLTRRNHYIPGEDEVVVVLVVEDW